MRKIYKEQQKYIAIIGSVFIGNPRKSHSGLKIRDFLIIIFDILLGEAIIAGQLMFIIDQWIFEGPITTPSERPTKKVKVCVSGQNDYSVIARSGVEVLPGL